MSGIFADEKLREDRLCNINLRRIPKWLRDRFKSACAARGMTMHQSITEFMEKTVRERNQLHTEKSPRGKQGRDRRRGDAP